MATFPRRDQRMQGFAFAWIAAEFMAFVLLIFISADWMPHMEHVARESGIAIAPLAMCSIRLGQFIRFFWWLLFPLVLVSVVAKARYVRVSPRLAGLAALLVTAMFLGVVTLMISSMQLQMATVAAGDEDAPATH